MIYNINKRVILEEAENNDRMSKTEGRVLAGAGAAGVGGLAYHQHGINKDLRSEINLTDEQVARNALTTKNSIDATNTAVDKNTQTTLDNKGEILSNKNSIDATNTAVDKNTQTTLDNKDGILHNGVRLDTHGNVIKYNTEGMLENREEVNKFNSNPLIQGGEYLNNTTNAISTTAQNGVQNVTDATKYIVGSKPMQNTIDTAQNGFDSFKDSVTNRFNGWVN